MADEAAAGAAGGAGTAGAAAARNAGAAGDAAVEFPLPLFMGTHQPRMDDKGRLFLPAKFRDALAGGLVITRGQERCLYVFPSAEFGRMYARIRGAPVENRRVRDYSRLMVADAESGAPDKQGRVTIPPRLRDYAGLAKDCVVIGAGDRVEIWDTAAWEAYLAEQEDSFAELSEEVLPGSGWQP